MKIDFQDRGLSFDHVNSNDTHMFVYRLHPDNGDSSTGHAEQKLLSDHLHQALHKILSSETQSFHKIYPGRAYLDIDCVPCLAAQETRASRARYLWNCSVFVPVITWGQEHSVLEELAGLDEEHDRESDFLVHALAAIFLLNKDAGRLKAVLPILRDESGGRTSLSSVWGRLSTKASARSCERASTLLEEGGVRRANGAILEYLRGVSVREAVAMLLPADRRAELGIAEETGRAKRSKGVHGMYVTSDGDVERSAREAGELIAGCLVRVVKEHIDRKLWEFSNHNPRGIEVLQVLREGGMYEEFYEHFALGGIETLENMQSITSGGSTRIQSKSSLRLKFPDLVIVACDEIGGRHKLHKESSMRTLGKLVEEYRTDERFLPLNERLRIYRDTDVNGVLALRTTNSLETAMLKLPARSCVVFLIMVYLVFGITQLGQLKTDQLWLPERNSTTPVEPKTVRISTVAAPIISFCWSFLFLSGVVTGLVSTPLRAKWLLLATGYLVTAANVFCMVSDIVQCSTEGTGIGSGCNSNLYTAAALLLAFIMYLAHNVPHYFWTAAFFMQGAFCLLLIFALKTMIERFVSLFLTVGCWAVGLAIVVQYRLAYRKTFQELKAAMQGFDETWSKVVEEKSLVVEEISRQVRPIAQELEDVIRDDTRTWSRYLQVSLGLRGRRYSRRNGKIRQVSRDFEQLFLQAQEISAAFQLWVSGWNQVGRVQHGNVKSCSRAIQKTVRSYRRDPSCLTDLVRCTIVVQSIQDVLTWVNYLRGHSVVGFGVGAWDKAGGGQVTPEELEMGGEEGGRDIYMSITSIKNRYDPSSNTSISGAYRDLCVCVEVGWTIDETSQGCTFVQVKDWDRTAGLRKHICEIQVLLEEMQGIKKMLHKEYVNFRNIFCE